MRRVKVKKTQYDQLDRSLAKQSLKSSKHVKRHLLNSPIIKTGEDRKQFLKWESVLEKDGLRAFDNTYQGYNKRHVPNGRRKQAGMRESGEYYAAYESYCQYYEYELRFMRLLAEPQRKHFKEMLWAYMQGISMPKSYKIISDRYNGELFSAVYFYKRFQEAKEEFLNNHQQFADYQEYCKYVAGEPASYEHWLQAAIHLIITNNTCSADEL